MSKTPLVVNANGDLTFFASAAAAEQYLEAIDVRNGEYVAYDAEGRVLVLGVEEERVPVWFGLSHAVRERVRVGGPAEAAPRPAELRGALLAFLAALGQAPADAEHLSLEALVARGAGAAGLT